MSIVVFAGPTIAHERVRQTLDDVIVLPPAEQGDLHRAAMGRPEAIALIDGCFERVPAVWHKEVLHALALGVPVFGASSMGALRAAELHAFGMIGVGRVFALFADGTLEDDDEVAVLHAPGQLGFRQVSEAMVDIRATLARARDDGLLEAPLADRLSRAAKALPYPDRSVAAAINRVRADTDTLGPTDRTTLLRLSTWLPTGFVSWKARDADALLEELARCRREGFAPPAVDFRFEHTEVWARAVSEMEAQTDAEPDAEPDTEPADTATRTSKRSAARTRLDAARLSPERGRALRRHAVARRLATDRAIRLHRELDAPQLVAEAALFRRANRLEDAEAMQAWLHERGMDEAGFLRWLGGERHVRAAEHDLGPALEAEMLECLCAQEPSSTPLLRAPGERAGREAVLAWLNRRLFDEPARLTAPELAEWCGYPNVERMLAAAHRVRRAEREGPVGQHR